MSERAKFQVGQIVHAWNGIRRIKIKRKYLRKKGDQFDGWWYVGDDEDEQEYSERECKALTKRECGGSSTKR